MPRLYFTLKSFLKTLLFVASLALMDIFASNNSFNLSLTSIQHYLHVELSLRSVSTYFLLNPDKLICQYFADFNPHD